MVNSIILRYIDDFIKEINNNISIVKFFPIITESTFQKFFLRPIEAVIIETYGSGNMSTDRKGILEILKEACNDGIIIVNVSQCRKGLLIDSYETSNILSQIGVIFSGDMTVECALSKLSYLLGVNIFIKIEIFRQKSCKENVL